MASIYHNLKIERQYSASTGLNKAQFDELATQFALHYQPKNNRITTGEPPLFHDPKEALFFILFYLKNYPTLQVLGLQFDMSDFSASTYINYIMPYLKASLRAKSMLVRRVFEDQAAFEKTFENVEDIFIDCTEIPVERAKNEQNQKKAFSGKKISYLNYASYL